MNAKQVSEKEKGNPFVPEYLFLRNYGNSLKENVIFIACKKVYDKIKIKELYIALTEVEIHKKS